MTSPTGSSRRTIPEPESPGPEIGVAFGPREIVGGFALIATLILLLLRRRRGDRSRDR